jgi:hypothetical protein
MQGINYCGKTMKTKTTHPDSKLLRYTGIKEPMKVIEQGKYITRMVLSEDDFEKEPNT